MIEEESKGLEKNKVEEKELSIKNKMKKIRNINHLFFAVAKQSVSIVNKITGREYTII